MNFHGGNIYEYDGELLDFSSNINPMGVPESFKRALFERLEDFTKYPDIKYTELKRNIGAYLGVMDSVCIVPGNGAVELLYKTVAQSGCHRVYGLCPTFSEYSRAAAMAGLEYIGLEAYDEEYQGIDLEALVSAMRPRSLLVVCNPNNPTGTLISRAEMGRIAWELEKRGCMLLIDEAFMEFTENYPQSSMLQQIEEYQNIVIVKAATKFFGIPGIRLGYAVTANRKLAMRIANSLEPWNINTAAIIAGSTIFTDREYIKKSREWIGVERNYLFEALNTIEGLKPYKSASNFHTVRIDIEDMDAWKLRDILLEKGILIRTPEGFTGLTSQHVRLAVKDRCSNDKLLEALRQIMKSQDNRGK